MFRDSADARCGKFVQEKSGRFGTPGEPIRRKGDWLESRYVGRIEASKGPPLRMGRTSEGADVAAGRVMCEPTLRLADWLESRFGGRENGGRADSAEGRMVEESIQRVC